VDAEMRWSMVTIRTAGLLAETQRDGLFDSRSFMVEGAVQVIPDFADVRVRYDSAYGPAGWDAHRVNVGMAFFYIDGVAPAALTSAPEPMGGIRFGRAFTLLWLRSYDLMRFSPTRRSNPPARGDLQGNAIFWGDVGRWLVSGDTDQLVVRITF